jgi:hypothetical protein
MDEYVVSGGRVLSFRMRPVLKTAWHESCDNSTCLQVSSTGKPSQGCREKHQSDAPPFIVETWRARPYRGLALFWDPYASR